MHRSSHFQLFLKCFLAIFFLTQTFGITGSRVFADTSAVPTPDPNSTTTPDSIAVTTTTDDSITIKQEVAAQLPLSATAYTKATGSSDYQWVPVARYLANLKPTSDYTSWLSGIKKDTAGTDIYPKELTSLTTLEKTLMGVTSTGNDATNINGVNLIEKLYSQSVITDGNSLGTVIYGLLALDAKPYVVPQDAMTTQSQLVQSILAAQLPSGGWGFVTLDQSTWKAANYDSSTWKFLGYRSATDYDFSTDMTGMALTALAPYQANPQVQQAIERAVKLLQTNGDMTNCNSLAQMIIGLCSVHVDPTTFNDTNLVQKLLAFAGQDGLFKYNNAAAATDSFSTQDAIGALAAYLKYANGSGNSTETIYYAMKGPGTQSDSFPSAVGGQAGAPITPQGQKVTVYVTGYQGQPILPASSVDLQPNSTPYSVLIAAMGSGNVSADGSGGSVYVKSIGGLAEFDKGPLSGWMYTVNGQFTSVGAGSYPLKNGDTVQWIYTADGGKDAGAPSSSSTGTDSKTSAQPDASVVEAINSVPLPVDNTKPVDQVSHTVVVQQVENRMTADQAENIKQTVTDNSVNISQASTPTADQSLSDGAKEVQVFIPQNALSDVKTISVKEERAQPERKELLSSIYDFEPNGTHFAKPISITVKVPLEVQDLSQVALAWLDEATNKWVPIPAVLNAKTGEVTGQVNHFTQFAVINRSALSPQIDVGQAMQAAGQYILKGTNISDWAAFALSRAGIPVPANYLDDLKKTLQQKNGALRNITDYERMVLGVLAASGDPLNVSGYNLIEKIYTNSRLTSQGTNGVIFALIALDSNGYQVPDKALWNQAKLVDWLIKNQNADGGWSLVAGDKSDLDLTSMTLAALAPYQQQPEVKKAVDAALEWLTTSGSQPMDNSESIAQEIQGLAAVGSNPADAKFNRAGKNLIASLLQFQQQDGGFVHQAGQKSDPIATEQALAALNAYQSFIKGTGSIYQFTKKPDAAIPDSSKPVSSKPDSSYTDADQIASWALSSVLQAKQLKLMQGSNGAFAPKHAITRAEFTKVIVNLLNEKESSGRQVIFGDVKPGSWYYGSVMTARAKGLISGISGTAFGPDQPITREQAAAIIAKAWHMAPQKIVVSFKDWSQIDAYAMPAIQALYKRGIMVGDNGSFNPRGKVTREMAAVLAVKLYNSSKPYK
ncbi:S-layer homology domain-containing protein [Aneurinibacillus sp. Ricciae_BoGa-3]|uniref:S-layer homology domain-containing protein n=1 Tax=Aneurinibacillus sp. Ricciae_BoGa-3 TaxID=3022697 RepID=UPI002341C8E5|nr:S-layer homology domain-containing protein [Aneurinibacillus sp. Ricciae_BoGa-3]WCK56602.1 S-layer homology domain-containing protein [Aneurinibacillus sp. Ricciae_BoGa-3]